VSQYVIGFLMFPFIIKYVGVEDYGLYLLVGAFVGYFGLLDFWLSKWTVSTKSHAVPIFIYAKTPIYHR
jgi:hypothetical protein